MHFEVKNMIDILKAKKAFAEYVKNYDIKNDKIRLKVEHIERVSQVAKKLATKLELEDEDIKLAELIGLLHDIGRYAGVSSERHLIDGYRFCMERGWEKAAQICISHAFMIQDIHTSIGTFDVTEEDFCFMEKFVQNAVYDDYDRLVQLCDALALPTGFCILEKRFVDVTIRYGVHPYTVDRWKKVLEIKADFEKKIKCSIYDLLPGAIENSPDDVDKTVVAMHAGPYSEQFNNNIADVFEFYLRRLPGLQFCVYGHGHQLAADDFFDDGVIYYQCPCVKKRVYLHFTIDENGYEYEAVDF